MTFVTHTSESTEFLTDTNKNEIVLSEYTASKFVNDNNNDSF